MRRVPLLPKHLARARTAALQQPLRVRARLTLLYGWLFVVSGAVLLTITYLLVASFTGAPHIVSSTMRSTSETGPPQSFDADELPEPYLRQLQAAAAANHQELMHRLLLESVIALAITTVIAMWLGWVVAGRVLRPLRSMTTTLQQITARNVHERLALSGPRDELRDLADTVDGLLGRLETALDSHKRFVANAAHELRTPLTLEHALLEESLMDGDPTVESFRENFGQLLAISKNQGRLLESLLVLSTSERGLVHPEPVNLAELAQPIIMTFRPAAERHALVIDADIETARLSGDPVLVGRLVANLLDNATYYNVPGGRVKIRVGTRSGRAFLVVANTGKMIPADQVDRLFNPFQRLDRSADDGHHGLGLSIVRTIVDAHAAELTAHAGPEGGLVVKVVFPSPAPSQRRSSPASRGDAVTDRVPSITGGPEGALEHPSALA